MSFDPYWSGQYYSFYNNNTIASFNQPSTNVLAERADYHLYPCCRISTCFYEPFRVVMTFYGGDSWFGIGLPTANSDGFEAYTNKAWLASTELQYFCLNKQEQLSWVNFFNKNLILRNTSINFGMGFAANQTIVITCHPQDKWMIVTSNSVQIKYNLTDLPQNGTGYYFLVSMARNRAEVHYADRINFTPINNFIGACSRHAHTDHHFYIAYSSQSTTDSQLALSLSNEIENKAISHISSSVRVFMDSICVPHSATYASRFELGLSKARVIVLLISEDSMSNIINNAVNQQDNFLLDIENSLLRQTNDPLNTVAIFPIFVGKNPKIRLDSNSTEETEVWVKYFPPYLSTIPDSAHVRPYKAGYLPSIRATMAQIFQLQGFFLDAKESLFEIIHFLFFTLNKVNAARKEFLIDPPS